MADLRSIVSRPARRLLAAAVTALGLATAAAADTPGVVIKVPSPVTQNDVTRIKAQLAAVKPGGDARPVAVFDFTPADKPAATPDDGASAAADLAYAIADRPDVTSVAFLRRKVSGHTVLPVLACAELTVGPGAELGQVVAPGEPPLVDRRAAPFIDIAARARPAYAAVARKMFDRNVQLRAGKKGAAAWYLDLRDRAKAEADGVTVTNTAPPPDAPDGAVLLLNAAQLRQFGLAKGTAATLSDVAQQYGLPPAAVAGGDAADRPPMGFRTTIRGPIDGGVSESVGRTVADSVRNGATVIVLQLEAAGGDPQAARDLADKLADVQQKDNVRVIAFVPDRAPDTAAIVALGCSEIVLSRRTDAPAGADGQPQEAEFGDFDTAAGKQILATNAKFWQQSLRDLAERQGYPPLIAEGFVNPDLDILRVSSRVNAGQKRFMTPSELDAAKADFTQGKQVKARGQLLKLTASQAEEYRLARTVATRDVADVYALYGLDPSKVADAAPAWLDRLAAFLKLPSVTVLLVAIGFIGLILEMKVPGTALPGIVAALCFILIFWAHTQFSGQVAVLAGLLFILGLVLVLLEVFVLPGFGVPGILGVAFILGSLGLATVGATDGPLPSTTAEWTRLGGKMGQYLFAMIGATVVAFMVVRYLPQIPGANRLALLPPDDSPEAAAGDVPGAAQAAALLGAVGMSVTVLRPAGSVRFADDFVDVVSEGGYVPAGARVQVVEVEGNRIVVREV